MVLYGIELVKKEGNIFEWGFDYIKDFFFLYLLIMFNI